MALLRSSVTVGGWTFASRILGFARDILIARFLGTQGVPEAFFVAFRFPNLFRRLVAEGAFTAAFVPMFSGRLETEGKGGALRFAEDALAIMLTVLVVFTIVCEITMPWLMYAIAPGFVDDPETFDLAVLFTRLTLPYLLFMALVALYGGVLNSVYRFAAVAAAPVLLNVILIGALIVSGDLFPSAGHALSWGVAVAGAAQFLALVIAAQRAGLMLRLPRPRLTPDMRRLFALMLPGAIGAGVTQINLLIGTIIASFIPGAVSYLYYGERIYQFPLGVIGIAIGTALLPELSRKLRGGEHGAAQASFNRAIEISMLITLPAAAALIAIPGTVVTVMFQYGRFGPGDTAATAAALAAFAAGLPAYVLIKVLNPGFFAREDTRTPVIYAAIGVVLNIALSLILFRPLAHVGIAVATAVAAWVNAGLLGMTLVRRGHLHGDSRLFRRLPRIVLAAAVMAGLLLPLQAVLAGPLAADVLQRAGAMAVLVVFGVVVFAVCALAVKAADLGELRASLSKQPS
ncbi:MAG: murein biosynthesis integral membrane protein MurJ [Alphaproteobacteria bacterium]|nr:murein biosynthesis integral membrane protein MurJ [Alphaproteobacteria bacterium]